MGEATPLYNVRVKIQEQSLALRQGAHRSNVAGALDEIGAELEKAIGSKMSPHIVGDELAKFFKDVVGVCVATNHEYHCLWLENRDTAKRKWDSEGIGYGHQVGVLGDRPVSVSLRVGTIDGHRILFVDPTSVVIDHDMIEEWLKLALPESAFKHSRFADRGIYHRADPTNFWNLFCELDRAKKEEIA